MKRRFLANAFGSVASIVLAIALSLAIVSSAAGSPETLSNARATSAEVDAAVAELETLRSQGSAADPSAVRAAGARLQAATGSARTLLDAYVKERGPIGRKDSAIVVRMMERIRAGRAALRALTGVGPAPRPTGARPSVVRQVATGIARREVSKRLKELGLDGAVLKNPRKELEKRATKEVNRLIRRESPNILVEATAASLFLGGSPRKRIEQVVRQRIRGLVARLVVRGDPLKGFVLRLIGVDKALEEVVTPVVNVVAWAPQQVLRFFRRIGRKSLLERAGVSTKGLRNKAMTLKPAGRAKSKVKTLAQARDLIRQAERTIARSWGLREQLKRDGRGKGERAERARKALLAHTRALTAYNIAAKTVVERFGLNTELYKRRRGFRDELAGCEREIARMLDQWDGTVQSGGGTGGVRSPVAGRATQASCLSPIQVDTGVFSPNINDYAVTGAETKTNSITCQYVRTDDPPKGGPSLTIWFGSDNGRCGEASLDPVRDSTGTRHSTRRTISAILIWSGSWRLDGPEGWAENVIRAAEAEGAGTPCPGGAPI